MSSVLWFGNIGGSACDEKRYVNYILSNDLFYSSLMCVKDGLCHWQPRKLNRTFIFKQQGKASKTWPDNQSYCWFACCKSHLSSIIVIRHCGPWELFWLSLTFSENKSDSNLPFLSTLNCQLLCLKPFLIASPQIVSKVHCTTYAIVSACYDLIEILISCITLQRPHV